MAKLNSIVPNVDLGITGKAQASDSQVRSINSSPIPYIVGHAYFVPMQWAHTVPSAQEGFAPSKRVFALELELQGDKLVPTGVLTAIKVSSIMQTHMGEVVEGQDAPQVLCEANDAGAMRPVKGQEGVQYFNAVSGPRCLKVNPEDKAIKVTAPVLYWNEKQVKVYTPTFEENSAVHSMMVDDDNYLQLSTPTINIWRTQPASAFKLNYSLKDIVPADTPFLDELAL